MKLIYFFILAFLFSCSNKQKIISTLENIRDTNKETGPGLKIVRENKNSTYAYVTLLKSEQPHVHDHNDVTAYVLKNGATLHFETEDIPLKAGQLIVIPKKTKHHISIPEGKMAKAFLIITPKIGKGFKRYVK